MTDLLGFGIYTSDELCKARSHKYLKKVPTGKTTKTGLPKYRYIYKVQHKGGIMSKDDFVVGASFSVGDGHYHITEERADGSLVIHHDETDQVKVVNKDVFSQMLFEVHKAALQEYKDGLEKRLETLPKDSYWHKRVSKQLAVYEKLPLEQLQKGYKDPVETVHSEAFKNWFGDWEKGEGSKCVDAEGYPENQYGNKPVKMFHGTPVGGFQSFSKDKDKGYNIFGKGFYFTADYDIAKSYTKKDEKYKLAATKGLFRDGKPLHFLSKKELNKLADKLVGKNPNWSPNQQWALYAATEKQGKKTVLNVSKFIEEFFNPSFFEDWKKIYNDKGMSFSQKEASFNALYPVSQIWQNKFHELGQGSSYGGMSSQGATKTMQALISAASTKTNKATPDIPEAQVFEVYLNIRKPVDMEKPVPKDMFKSLAIHLGKKDESRYKEWVKEGKKQIEKYEGIIKETATLSDEEIKELHNETREEYLSYYKKKIEDQKGYNSVYQERLKRIQEGKGEFMDFHLKSLNNAGDVSKTYDGLLKMKQDFAEKTYDKDQVFWNGRKVKKGDPVFPIFQLTPKDQLTWGDLHYIITDGHDSGGNQTEFTKWAQSEKYDGIRHTGGWNIGSKAHDVWIAFEPNQIKATNSEKFDSGTDNIFKSKKYIFAMS